MNRLRATLKECADPTSGAKTLKWFGLFVTVAFVSLDVCAQTASKPFAFDVSSIHRNVDNIGTCSPSQIEPTEDGFHMTNCPLLMAVGAAYVPTTGNPLDYLVQQRIVGMPKELSQERYDIDARVADPDAEAWRDPVKRGEMLHAMMQSLLAERCKLVVHRAMRERPVYALVVAKNGPRLKAAERGETVSIRAKHSDAVGVPGGSGFFVRSGKNGHIDIYGAAMGTLALLLSGPAGRPVVDKTGLTGIYDMHLDMGQPGPPAADGSADAGPSVFSSLREQLGLKLEAQKDQVEYLVIDHIEPPSPN
ncbi:MAG TPA: TIGR03435 family protein [Acidobacteriaceae bacterium]|nr:TIGR03435 family protein [Acidobacteriaceae bacterium]